MCSKISSFANSAYFSLGNFFRLQLKLLLCQLKECFSDKKGGNSLLIEAVKRDSTGIVLLILVCVYVSVCLFSSSLCPRLSLCTCVSICLCLCYSVCPFVSVCVFSSLCTEKAAATLITCTPLQQGKEQYGDEINRQNLSGDTALIVARSILSTSQPPALNPKALTVARCASRL